jgi:cation transport ATPase
MDTKAKSLMLTKEGDLPEEHEANQAMRWRLVSGSFFVGLGSLGVVSVVTKLFAFNWWALLLFLPVMFLGERVIRTYAHTKTFTEKATQDILGWAGIIFAIATTLLFNLNWLYLLPVLLLAWGATHMLVSHAE